IKMEVTKSKPKEEDSEEYVEYVEEETINSMIPIWRKNKSELTDEDYVQFYQEKHYGFDEPLTHIHANVDGNIRYNAILYVAQNVPFDYYSEDYKKGLEIYTNGVLIMEKYELHILVYYCCIKRLVFSDDLSIHIFRILNQ